MIKTQIQIPDHLHREAKRIAEEYEMSFAEVVRRALERVIPTYPKRAPDTDHWELPLVDAGGSRVPLEQLKQISAEDEFSRGTDETAA